MKTFEHKTDSIKTTKSSPRIIKETLISSEYQSEHHELDLDFGKDRTRSFVLKDFSPEDPSTEEGTESAERYVLKSIEVHALLRSLGLPTYTTYRAEKYNTSILMTNLNVDGAITLSDHEPSEAWLERCMVEGMVSVDEVERFDVIKEIDNFSELLDDTDKCMQVCAENNIGAGSDAYFFVVKELTEGVFSAELVIGDLDGISFGDDEDLQDYPKNKGIRSALLRFVNTFVLEASRQKYIEAIKSRFDDELTN